MNTMSTYEALTLLLQSIVAILAFATLGFLYRQIRVMVDQLLATQHSSRAQTALAIVNFLQSAEARASRECVRARLSQKPLHHWNDEDKKHASLVCANYDVAAALLRADLAPHDLFVANWGPSICHCYEVLGPYISDLRAKPGASPSYWTNFDWLYNLAKAHNT